MSNFLRQTPQRGFTLVELLVVLFILVILAGVAVQSLDGVQDQSRYQATQQSMQNIEDAVLGPANQTAPDGTIFVTGFVADLGRLPQALPVTVTQADGTTATFYEPEELWANPNALIPFSLRHAWNMDSSEVALSDQDTNVYVSCGWRGPYLRLGAGQNDLKDGWGNPYELFQPGRDATPLSHVTGDPANLISIIRSDGANGTPDFTPTTGYNPDLYLNFNTFAFDGTNTPPNYPAVSASDRYHAAIAGNILGVDTSTSPSTITNPSTSTPGNIYVRFFAPNPNGAGILALTVPDSTMPVVPNPQVYSKTVNGVTLTVNIDTSASPIIVASYAVTNATIGPRIVRAYQGTLPTPGAATLAPGLKSSPTTLMIAAGGQSKDLILR